MSRGIPLENSAYAIRIGIAMRQDELRLVATSNTVPIAAFAWISHGCCDDFLLALGAMLVLGELLVRHLFLFICQLIHFYYSLIITLFLTAGLRRVFLIPIVPKIGLAPRRF